MNRARCSTFSLLGLACLTVAALAVSGCRTTSSDRLVDPETGDVLEPARPRQAVAAVHAIGIREEVPAESLAPFPAPGFAFEGGRIVARAQPGTIAGAVLSVSEAGEWMEALARSGTGVLFLSPVMALEPGRTSSVSNMTQETYTANMLLDREGGCVPQMETAWTGARVELFTGTCPDENALLVSLDVSMASTKTSDFDVVKGYENDEGDKMPPLTIQLPQCGVRRWQASALVPYSGSVVMAHWVRQYRVAALLGGERRMREHIVCLVTAGVKPPPVDSEADAEPYTAERFHYPISLAWYLAPEPPNTMGSSNEAALAPDNGAVRKMSAEDVAGAILAFRQNRESEAVCVGLASVPGRPAAADFTERHTYVGGVRQPVEDDPAEQRTFILSETAEGVEYSVELAAEEPLVDMRLRGGLGGPCELEVSPETRRSLRSPPSEAVEEAYRFHERKQDCAEISADLRSRGANVFRIAPHWTEMSSPRGRGVPAGDHLVLIGLGEPISTIPPGP